MFSSLALIVLLIDMVNMSHYIFVLPSLYSVLFILSRIIPAILLKIAVLDKTEEITNEMREFATDYITHIYEDIDKEEYTKHTNQIM